MRKLAVSVALAFVLMVSCQALLSTVTRVPTLGAVKTVGVDAYWDADCTHPVTEVNWGLVEPGSLVDVTFFLRNPGNAPVTLSLSTENWNPANASSYLSLTWDYTGQTLSPEDVVQVTLTLSVAANVTGITSFAFDILITATG